MQPAPGGQVLQPHFCPVLDGAALRAMLVLQAAKHWYQVLTRSGLMPCGMAWLSTANRSSGFALCTDQYLCAANDPVAVGVVAAGEACDALLPAAGAVGDVVRVQQRACAAVLHLDDASARHLQIHPHQSHT